MRSQASIIALLALFFSACAVFIPMRVGPAEDIIVEITPERVALGAKLAEGIMACGSCHTTGNFDGEPRQDMYLAGDVFTSKLEGTIRIPNITPDTETGIGAWTDGEIIRALTKGLSRDNRQLVPFMPWPEFGLTLTQEETYAIVAYLRTVPEPVRYVPPESDLTAMVSFAMSTGIMRRMFTKGPLYGAYEPRLDTPEGRGLRLAYLGKCVDCHAYMPGFPRPPKFGDPLAGGLVLHKPGADPVVCSNLTPDEETGIGGFTDEEVYQAIKFGKRLRPLPDNEMVRWPMMPRIPFHTSLTDEEIGDLIAFFRSQEPIKHGILKIAAELVDD